MKILAIEMNQTVREHLCKNNCIKCISHVDDNDNITYGCSLYMNKLCREIESCEHRKRKR